MTTREQIESFYRFALQQIDRGTSLSFDDLLECWQGRNLSEEELSASTAAVQSALRDMENGDRGRPLEEVLAEIRADARARRT